MRASLPSEQNIHGFNLDLVGATNPRKILNRDLELTGLRVPERVQLVLSFYPDLFVSTIHGRTPSSNPFEKTDWFVWASEQIRTAADVTWILDEDHYKNDLRLMERRYKRSFAEARVCLQNTQDEWRIEVHKMLLTAGEAGLIYTSGGLADPWVRVSRDDAEIVMQKDWIDGLITASKVQKNI